MLREHVYQLYNDLFTRGIVRSPVFPDKLQALFSAKLDLSLHVKEDHIRYRLKLSHIMYQK